MIKNDGRGALCDFGSAHELDDMFQEIATKGTQCCTVRWASPERLDSNDPPEPSSDVWSWGWLTWEVRLPNRLKPEPSIRSDALNLDYDGKSPVSFGPECFLRNLSYNFTQAS